MDLDDPDLDPEVTELYELTTKRVSGVTDPANGTPFLLWKAAAPGRPPVEPASDSEESDEMERLILGEQTRKHQVSPGERKPAMQVTKQELAQMVSKAAVDAVRKDRKARQKARKGLVHPPVMPNDAPLSTWLVADRANAPASGRIPATVDGAGQRRMMEEFAAIQRRINESTDPAEKQALGYELTKAKLVAHHRGLWPVAKAGNSGDVSAQDMRHRSGQVDSHLRGGSLREYDQRVKEMNQIQKEYDAAKMAAEAQGPMSLAALRLDHLGQALYVAGRVVDQLEAQVQSGTSGLGSGFDAIQKQRHRAAVAAGDIPPLAGERQ